MRSLKNIPGVKVTDLPNGRQSFYIDVGDMSPKDAERFLKDVKKQFGKNPVKH